MESSGDDNKKAKPKGPPVDYKFPPKRSAKEWRQLTQDKLRQLENIAMSYMGKPSYGGGGNYD